MRPRALVSRASSSRNRWLVVGLALTVAAALLAALSFAGVFDRTTRRDAVVSYIDDVNAVERSAAAERQTVDNVYRRIRADPKTFATSGADLARSARSLHAFDRHLRALTPPPEAAELHRRLIALSAAEATFADQIVLLRVYLPTLAVERQAVAMAGTTLQRDLSATKTPGQQAAVFDRFATSLAVASKPLRKAPVPTAMRQVKADEIRRISELGTTANGLANALRNGRSVEARALVRRFGTAAAGNGNAVERKAVIVFDAQARRIETLRLRVAEERSRLDRTVR